MSKASKLSLTDFLGSTEWAAIDFQPSIDSSVDKMEILQAAGSPKDQGSPKPLHKILALLGLPYGEFEGVGEIC